MNKEIYESLNDNIANINDIYAGLSLLSNDELREKSNLIQTRIRKSKDDKILDDLMVEVFAIMKETARRFCIGNIEVTAKEFDKKNAQQYDFVTIEEDRAIYHNKWIAGGVEATWHMTHYDTQIMSGILLHKGCATEMATGEGKTLAVTMPAFLNAICHKGVHIQTANDYLSKRDCELTRPLYCFHGLTVDCIEYYNNDLKKKRKAYSSDIVFGSNQTFVFDYLRDHLVHDLDETVQSGHNYCIIDELDSILIDRACTPHIIEGDVLSNNMKVNLEAVKPKIEKFIHCDNFDNLLKVDNLRQQLMFSEEGLEWLNKEFNTKGLFSITQDELNSKDEKIQQDIAKRNQLSQSIFIMLNAYLLFKKDVHYVVDRDKIIIIDPNTGRLDYDSRWENGLHTAVELKENVSCKEEHRPDGTISLGNYLKLYKKVAGTSGTLWSVSEELKDCYGLQYAKVPTHKPCIRKDHSIKVYKNQSDKYKAVIREIKKYHNQHRPILVSCSSTKESDLLYDMLVSNKIESKKLNAKNLEKEAYIISHAGEVDSVMVSTAIAGRGTDIKLTEDAKKNGGLVVISTCLFDSSRIDNQLKGRAGRQGDPGDSVFFVSLDDLIIQNLSDEERDKLNAISDANKLNTSLSRNFILAAQNYREAGLRNAREYIRKKDDVFSRYRKRFYKARNNILKHPESCYNVVRNGAKAFEVENGYNEHLDLLYKQVCFIIKNAQRNNVDGRVSILFSAKQYLYSIGFDIEKTLKDKEYFLLHLVQQITLNRYDTYWAYLIQRYQGIMDEKSLSKLYNSIKADLERNILMLLFNSCIPVNFSLNDDNNVYKDSEINVYTKQSIKFNKLIYPTSPCPCGSKKQYSECHGKRWVFAKRN